MPIFGRGFKLVCGGCTRWGIGLLERMGVEVVTFGGFGVPVGRWNIAKKFNQQILFRNK